MLHGHLTRAPALGVFPMVPPCWEAGAASPPVPLILALQKLLDLWQDGGA